MSATTCSKAAKGAGKMSGPVYVVLSACMSLYRPDIQFRGTGWLLTVAAG